MRTEEHHTLCTAPAEPMGAKEHHTLCIDPPEPMRAEEHLHSAQILRFESERPSHFVHALLAIS